MWGVFTRMIQSQLEFFPAIKMYLPVFALRYDVEINFPALLVRMVIPSQKEERLLLSAIAILLPTINILN